MQKLTKFLSLKTQDQALLLNAALIMLACRLGLHLLRFEDLRILTSCVRTEKFVPIAKLIWATQIARQVTPNPTCLVRALAASRLLAKYGYKSTLHIGVRRGDSGFEAHAWLEHDGNAIIGSVEAPGFTRLCSWEIGRGAA
ncbi:lasso peptide biosynthesis B2 protein [Methylocystis sp. H62]|uniref:lasso peptide biosynthesis B2 protein n=1 Tax=Methylocystis sp. H62 TaxID=2785789 RepID=UPI0018C1FE69|nr:lasso peptide biosynthesis B2 protein [Methylocystis sp. H62]